MRLRTPRLGKFQALQATSLTPRRPKPKRHAGARANPGLGLPNARGARQPNVNPGASIINVDQLGAYIQECVAGMIRDGGFANVIVNTINGMVKDGQIAAHGDDDGVGGKDVDNRVAGDDPADVNAANVDDDGISGAAGGEAEESDAEEPDTEESEAEESEAEESEAKVSKAKVSKAKASKAKVSKAKVPEAEVPKAPREKRAELTREQVFAGDMFMSENQFRPGQLPTWLACGADVIESVRTAIQHKIDYSPFASGDWPERIGQSHNEMLKMFRAQFGQFVQVWAVQLRQDPKSVTFESLMYHLVKDQINRDKRAWKRDVHVSYGAGLVAKKLQKVMQGEYHLKADKKILKAMAAADEKQSERLADRAAARAQRGAIPPTVGPSDAPAVVTETADVEVVNPGPGEDGTNATATVDRETAGAETAHAEMAVGTETAHVAVVNPGPGEDGTNATATVDRETAGAETALAEMAVGTETAHVAVVNPGAREDGTSATATVDHETAGAGTAYAERAYPESAYGETAYPESAYDESAYSEPASPETVYPDIFDDDASATSNDM